MITNKKIARIADCLCVAQQCIDTLRENENINDDNQINDDKLIDRYGLALREASILLYNQSNEMLTNRLSESNVSQRYEQQLCPLDRVAACLEKNAIHIRLPMLGNRQSRGQSVFKDSMYVDSVRYAIQTAPNYGEYDFSLYESKIVTFLFVYDYDAARRGWIADSDNHVTKYVLDEITGYLPGGDTPLTTSIFLTTLVTDKLETGTYICVTPSRRCLPVATDIVMYWSKTEYGR